MLIVCLLLNQTGRTVVRRMYQGLFERWPSPEALAISTDALEEYLRPLGLWRRRAKCLRTLSMGWLGGMSAGELPGVGPYALASYSIFVDGVLPVECPNDNFLAKYWHWRRRYEGKL